MTESFPRQHARTRRFTLGAPRDLTVSSDGRRVVFLRSPAGDDPVTALWTFDVETGEEVLVADPASLLGGGGEGDLPPAERARRERARESAEGIVAYAADTTTSSVAFALAGRPWLAGLGGSGRVAELATAEAVFDPRPDLSGRRVAYVADRALRLVGPEHPDRELVGEPGETISWGSAEFVAGEEMDRTRGYWWSPDGARLVVARVDVAPVATWYLADPTEPGRPPQSVRYPAAGTANAAVSLAIVDADGGDRVDVAWDADSFPYLADVLWTADAPLTLVLQTRDQRRVDVVTVDPDSGATELVASITDPVWVDLVAGAPRWWDGRLVTVAEQGGTRRLLINGTPATPDGLWVRSVVGAGDDGLVLTASADDPTQIHVHQVAPDGSITALTHEPGVHGAAVGGATIVVTSATLDADGTAHTVWSGGERVGVLTNHAETPVLAPTVHLMTAGERGVQTAVLFPGGDEPDPSERLPVLLDPYGGPHAQRVLRARSAFTTSQWFADQGFAVVVADGRGTPGRPGDWERSVWGDLAQPVLDDQIAALEGVTERYPTLDLDRVAIRGWSFGGYLAALAVLRRPDVFTAAIAGAPVTDWRLYDTHYTERYLGHPDDHPEHYDATSLLSEAAELDRPLLLIHGLADDNVVAAHTLQLSRALLEAGRPHRVLPLSGVTHMTPQEVVAENLLLLQVAFLREALGIT